MAYLELFGRRRGRPHNASGEWQGVFRRGHPDAVLRRYALACARALDGLLVSHLDVFEREHDLRRCTGYPTPGPEHARDLFELNPVTSFMIWLLPVSEEDLAQQKRLGRLLLDAQPQYATQPTDNTGKFISKPEALSGLSAFVRILRTDPCDYRGVWHRFKRRRKTACLPTVMVPP